MIFSAVFAASASAYDPGYNYSYDILSLSTADYDNHVVVGTSKDVTFDLPYVINGNYIDIVISTVSGSITSATAGYNSSSQDDLNVLKISSRLVRVFGTVTTRNFQEIVLHLNTDNSSTAVDFLSFKLFKPSVNIHQTLGRLSAQVLSHPEQHYGQTYYGEVLNVDLDQDVGTEIDTAAILLTCPQWQKFDHVEFMVYGKFSSIDALVARVDDVSVPYTVTLLDGSADIFSSHSDNVWRNMIISVDVREVVRSNSLSEDLRLRVDLNISFYAGSQALFYLNTVNGIIDSSVNVSNDFWWNKVISGVDDLGDTFVSAIDDLGDTFVSSISELSSQLGSRLSDIKTTLTALGSTVSSGFTSTITALQTGFNNVVAGLSSVNSSIFTFMTDFNNFVSSKFTAFVNNWSVTMGNLFALIDSRFESLWANIDARWTTFEGWLKATFDPDSSDIDSAGDQIADDVESIDQIEQDIFQDFNSNSHVITDSFSISAFASAFAFVGAILSGAWAGLGGYKVVFTLPIALAIVLYVCNRTPNFFRPHPAAPAVSKMDKKTG